MTWKQIRFALRRFQRTIGDTSLNLIGLTIGLTFGMLISAYVYHNLSYDDFHANADRIYRISMTETFQDERVPVYPPSMLGPALVQGSGDVEASVRMQFSDHAVYVSTSLKDPIREPSISFADVSFFNVFGFSLQKGDPETALKQPYSLVIAPSVARKYFGTRDPIGQSLTIDGSHTYTVTGVLAPPPGPSHFSIHLLASYSTLSDLGVDLMSWELGESTLYLQASDGCQIDCLRDRVIQRMERQTSVRRLDIIPEPISSVHLYGQSTDRQPRTADVRYLWLLGTIALLVLLVACVNYTNLTTARSLRHLTEVGVRKTLGATRSQLARSYFVEATMLCLGAYIMAVGLFATFLSPFETALGIDIQISTFWIIVVSFIGVALLTGVSSGMYPALYLSQLRPARVLRGNALSTGRSPFRMALIVFQFTVSIVFLAGAFIVHNQLRYIQNRDLGLDPENVIVINSPADLSADYNTLKSELLQLPGVSSVTFAPLPGHKNVPIASVRPEGQSDGTVWAPTFGVDADFLSTTRASLVEGRAFRTADLSGAGGAVLINQTAREQFGWKQAIGKRISLPSGGGMTEKQVVGVVRDFHYGSLEESIEPVVIHLADDPGRFDNVIVRVDESRLGQTVTHIGDVWSRVVPSSFVYQFMSRQFASYQRSEQKMSSVITLAAGLTALIAMLGLFGLAAYIVQKRMKEIGIRKALGASATDIVTLLVRNVAMLIGIAIVLAGPIVYVGVQRWLSQFAYRVSVGLVDLLIVCLAVTLLAGCAISYHLASAMNVAPVDHLRNP